MDVAIQGSATTEDNVLGQLLYSQKEAARFLQIGYLSLIEFPEVAKEIRLTADQAQTQHTMSVGLVKEFKSTANHVITRTVPLLKKSIEKRAIKMVQATFQKLLEYVERMIKKTETTMQQYALIKRMIQENISSVQMARDDVNREDASVDSDITLQMQELEVSRDEFLDLQAEREKMEKKIDDLYQKRHKFLDKAVPSLKEKTLNATVDNFLVPGIAVAAGAGGVVKTAALAAAGTTAATTVAFTAATLLPGAILVSGWMFNYLRRKNESDQTFKASDEVLKSLKMTQEQDDKAQARTIAIQEESIKKITMIKQNFLTKAFIGDPDSLFEAKEQFEEVSKHLQNILEIWINFAIQLSRLTKNTDDLQLVFYGYDDQPEEFADNLAKSIEDVKVAWTGFMNDCTGYSNESDREKYLLYGFLTEPLDELSIKERDEKRREILEKMESELENLTIGFTKRKEITT